MALSFPGCGRQSRAALLSRAGRPRPDCSVCNASEKAGEYVGRRPGGPPHKAKWHRLAILLLLLPAFTIAQSSEEQQAEGHARQSYALAQEGRLPESETEMQEAIRLSPKNPLYRSALAGLFVQDGKLSRAKTELEEALHLNPPEPMQARFLDRLKQIDLTFAAQLAQSGRYRDGLQVAVSAAERFSEEARVFQMLGYFQAKLQLNRDAVRSYSRALQLDPSSSEANVGLGTAQFSAGMENESVRTLEAGLVRFPSDANHYQALGVVLTRLAEEGQDTRARAQSLFKKALQIDGLLPEAHYELGVAALAAGDLGSAKNHLLVAERGAPNDSRVHFALARLFRLEDNTEASANEMKSFLAAKAAERSRGASTIGASVR